MHCPTCRNTPLRPTKLAPGLAAMGCAQCGGALVSLLYYRDWAERHTTEDVQTGEAEAQGEDSHAALNCPKCGRVMTKYRIAGDVGNRLDLCASCDEAWLDGGEWSLLKALELSDRLPGIFTEAWQLRIRREASEEVHRQRYRRLLGEEDFREAERIRQWVTKHRNRRFILDFLSYE